MMLQTEHLTETLPPEADNTEAGEMVIQGRFGELKFGPQNLLRLPNGLLGFSSHHNFGLANFPNQEFGRFKILQCLEDSELSFLVLPLESESDLINARDLDVVYEQLAIQKEDGAVLLILTARREEEKSVISANLRAPIFVDTRRQVGRQCVLSNPDYAIKHLL